MGIVKPTLFGKTVFEDSFVGPLQDPHLEPP